MGLFKEQIKGIVPAYKLQELFVRVDRLEEKVFKKKKPPTTLGQQILLLHHLGMLDNIRQLEISNAKKYELLAILLNGDKSNIKKAMEALPKKEEAELKIPYNYTALSEIFESVDLSTLAEQMNGKANKLEKKKDL